MMGFEPTTSTLARLRSTTELHPRVELTLYVGERMMGFEPTTSTLARLRSTTELHPRFMWYVSAFDSGNEAIIHV